MDLTETQRKLIMSKYFESNTEDLKGSKTSVDNLLPTELDNSVEPPQTNSVRISSNETNPMDSVPDVFKKGNTIMTVEEFDRIMKDV